MRLSHNQMLLQGVHFLRTHLVEGVYMDVIAEREFENNRPGYVSFASRLAPRATMDRFRLPGKQTVRAQRGNASTILPFLRMFEKELLAEVKNESSTTSRCQVREHGVVF